jgi:hypothetical protein
MSTDVADKAIETVEAIDKQSKPSPYDSDLPAGDAPAPPLWQVVAAAAAVGGWLLFILIMAAERVINAPR